MGSRFLRALLDVKRRLRSLLDQYGEDVLIELEEEDWFPIVATVEGIDGALKELKGMMDTLRPSMGIES